MAEKHPASSGKGSPPRWHIEYKTEWNQAKALVAKFVAQNPVLPGFSKFDGAYELARQQLLEQVRNVQPLEWRVWMYESAHRGEIRKQSSTDYFVGQQLSKLRGKAAQSPCYQSKHNVVGGERWEEHKKVVECVPVRNHDAVHLLLTCFVFSSAEAGHRNHQRKRPQAPREGVSCTGYGVPQVTSKPQADVDAEPGTPRGHLSLLPPNLPNLCTGSPMQSHLVVIMLLCKMHITPGHKHKPP